MQYIAPDVDGITPQHIAARNGLVHILKMYVSPHIPPPFLVSRKSRAAHAVIARSVTLIAFAQWLCRQSDMGRCVVISLSSLVRCG